MAKRSTIGENPLDAVRQESPLDAVVPDPSAPRFGRAQELSPEVKERLEKLEAGLRAAVAEAAQLRGWVAPLKEETAKATTQAAQLKSELAGLSAEVSRVTGELAGLRAELAQLKTASRTPSDIPWWMGGRKKG
jgi:septal ring factor EnvC (AmiA/AmiB activator)